MSTTRLRCLVFFVSIIQLLSQQGVPSVSDFFRGKGNLRTVRYGLPLYDSCYYTLALCFKKYIPAPVMTRQRFPSSPPPEARGSEKSKGRRRKSGETKERRDARSRQTPERRQHGSRTSEHHSSPRPAPLHPLLVSELLDGL